MAEIPTYEYNSGDSALQCMRGSAAVKEDYTAGFSDLVAYEKNTKKIVMSSITEPFISEGSPIPTKEGIDTYNNRILCFEGAVLSSTVDAVSFPAIVDFSSVTTPVGDTIGDFWDDLVAPAILKVVMTSATSAMISIGDISNADDPSGRLFFTSDNFATFTEKLSISNGALLEIIKREDSDTWTAAVYQLVAGGALDAQTLYVSFDGGDNWVIIDTTTYTSITGNAHTHMGRFYDDDTVFATYGDGIQSRLVKLTRPVDWDGSSVWDRAWEKNVKMTQISGFSIDGDKLYLRREGVDKNGSDLYIYDITNDTFDGNTFLTQKQDVDDGKPYLNIAADVGNGTLIGNGLYIDHAHQFGADTNTGGLLVSTDGTNWVNAYRSTKGVTRLTGFYNGQIVCRIYDAGGVLRLGLFPIPSVNTIDAVKVEKGQTSLIGLFDGTVTDNWETGTESRDSTLSVYSDSDRLYATETGIKIVATDNSYANAGQWRLDSELSDTAANIAATKPQRILSPKAGDYGVVSYDIKYEGYNAATIASVMNINSQSGLAAVGGVAVINTYPISNDWLRVFISWKTLTSDTTLRALQMFSSLDEGAYVFNPNVIVKIQNVNYYQDIERVDLRSYIPKGDRADDYSVAPLTGLGAAWSVTFDWVPFNGNLAYPTNTVTTLPIATIKGSEGQYLKLYWDRAAFDGVGGGMAFKLTDGTTTISLDTEQDSVAMTWLHNDLLKFGITSDGTDTVLYCFNPENKAIHGSAILSNTDATTNIDLPTSILLGTNDDETIIGTGTFANIRGFDSVLSAGDVADVFDSVSDLIPATSTGSGNRYSGGGRYGGR